MKAKRAGRYLVSHFDQAVKIKSSYFKINAIKFTVNCLDLKITNEKEAIN